MVKEVSIVIAEEDDEDDEDEDDSSSSSSGSNPKGGNEPAQDAQDAQPAEPLEPEHAEHHKETETLALRVPRVAELQAAAGATPLSVGRQFRILRALMRPPTERSPRDVVEIMQALDVMDDQFVRKMAEHTRKAICKRLVLESFPMGEQVFDYGDRGDKFYLILSGQIKIEVPQDTGGEELELVTVGYLDAGKGFGELALMSADSRRRARITAAKTLQLLALTADDWHWCVGLSKDNYVTERLSFLRSADRALLQGVPEAELRTMAGLLREERYIGEQVVLKQGAEVDRIIFVKSGICRVIRQLHPRYREQFAMYAEHGGPPNPFTSASGGAQAPAGAMSSSTPEDDLGLGLGLGGRAALRKLLQAHQGHETESPSSPRSARGRQGARLARGEAAGEEVAVTSPRRSRPAPAGPQVQVQSLGENVDDVEQQVIVYLLPAGRSFGIMELMEGITYQCSVVANPWADVYVVTKYDLLRNTSKAILHHLFCDYKARLSDERLVQRLKQKSKWNSYKSDLLDDIRTRKHRTNTGIIGRSAPPPRRAGTGNLAPEDYERIGAGDKFWDKRASTPPKATYVGKNGTQVEHHFKVHCVHLEDGSSDVVVDHEIRDASMAALDERIVLAIATARYRDKLHRSKPVELGDSARKLPEVPKATAQEQKPALPAAASAASEGVRPAEAPSAPPGPPPRIRRRAMPAKQHPILGKRSTREGQPRTTAVTLSSVKPGKLALPQMS